MRKGYIRIVVMLIVTVTLAFVGTACKDKDKALTKASKERYAKLKNQVAVADEGIFYIGNDSLIHFASVETQEDVIFCTDLNCKHIAASMDNPNPECRAALFNAYTKIAYYEGDIYYFVRDDVFEHSLYKMNINGAGRELIASFPFIFEVGYAAVFKGNYLYYTANEFEIDEETLDIKRYPRLVEVNITDGSYRFLTEVDKETSQYIESIDVAGDSLYLTRCKLMSDTGGYRAYTTRIDLNTLEETMVKDLEQVAGKRYYVNAYDEESFFYNTVDTMLLGIYNTVTGEDTVLVEADEGKTLSAGVYAGNKGIVYLLTDNETKQSKRYYYDVASDVTREFKEEYTDHLFFYDGFRQICVYNVLGEDGRTIIGKTAVRLEDALVK